MTKRLHVSRDYHTYVISGDDYWHPLNTCFESQLLSKYLFSGAIRPVHLEKGIRAKIEDYLSNE